MIAQNDVKLTLMTRTYARLNGENVPAYEIHFTIKGTGDYIALVPISGFTPEKGMIAVANVAEPVIEFMNRFPS